MLEMSRKNLSQALFNYWIYEDLTDRKEIHQTFFRPYYQNETDSVVTFQETVERFLENVENKRIKEIYQHDDCTPECKKRGCRTVWSADGLWKLSYPICMCDVRVLNFIEIHYKLYKNFYFLQVIIFYLAKSKYCKIQVFKFLLVN